MKRICSLLLLLLFISYCQGRNDASANEQPKIIKPREPLRWPYIRCTLQDRSGNIWFGTSDQGVYRYNGRTFTNFTTMDGLMNNKVVTMMEDRAGNIWFGTASGACRWDGKTFTNIPIPGTDGATFFTSIGAADIKNTDAYCHHSKAVVSIIQDKRGVVWLGADDGVYRYEVRTGVHAGTSLTQFLDNECAGTRHLLPDNIITNIYEDRKGAIWFGSRICGYLYRLDASRAISPCLNNSCTHDMQKPGDLTAHKSEIKTCFAIMKTDEGMDDIAASSILEDKKGNIWFGTYDSGVYRYDGRSLINFSKKEGLLNTYVSAMFEDKAGNIWLGTTGRCSTSFLERGVFRYDGKTLTNYTKKDGLAQDGIECFAEDKAGNILIGTNGYGVYSFNGKTFTNLNERDGLSSSYIRSTITDKNGNVWFGTMDLGVSRYKESPQPGGKGSFINFTTTDRK